MIASMRRRVLDLFSADPRSFDVVFTADASAATKLVAEAFCSRKVGFCYYYHHQSNAGLLAARELARESRCLSSAEETEAWLNSPDEVAGPTLFAYPAQSDMDGERLPLHWPSKIRGSSQHLQTYTLLDATAFVATTPFDLSSSNHSPDFVVLSFSKIFGYPNLGALIVRKASVSVFDQGVCSDNGPMKAVAGRTDPWTAYKQPHLHARLEGGTPPCASVLALACAIYTHRRLFGGLDRVSRHTMWLASVLYERLIALKHFNGVQACHIYKAPSSHIGNATHQGATLALSLRASKGTWLRCRCIEPLLLRHGFHVRIISLCHLARQDSTLSVNGRPDDMIRITFGAMSTLADVCALVEFMRKNLLEGSASSET